MAIIKRFNKKNGKKRIFYQAQVYVRGYRIAHKSFETKALAVIWHEEQKKRLTKDPSSFFETEKSEMLFSDCLKKYIDEAFPLLQKSTRQAYENRFVYLTKSPLTQVKMSEFKAQIVYNWIGWLKKQKTAKNKGRKSFFKEVELLRTILHWHRNFVDEDFIVPITKKHRQLCYYKNVPPKRPDYYAKPEELRAFVKWLKEHRSNPVYWRLALFMILTGARVSEACGMCWDAVDLEKGQAQVIRRMAWEQRTKRPYLEERTKTLSSVRILLLSDELVSVLKEMKEECQNQAGLLFTDIKGEALKYNAIQSSFNAGFKALDLPWRSTHILRHSYATAALQATGSLSAVQATLGHSSSRMTERYAKAIALLDKGVVEKTAKFFDIFNKKKISN